MASESTVVDTMELGEHITPTNQVPQANPVTSNSRHSLCFMERFRPSPQTIEDAIMGVSDGMTVPFALTASLVNVVPNARYVMLAGLAELIAGAISMGLGGTLQALSERDAYQVTSKKTSEDLRTVPNELSNKVDESFASFNFAPDTLALITRDVSAASPEMQTNFVVQCYHQISTPDDKRLFKSFATLGTCYFLAGFLGLIPYICVQRHELMKALEWSIGIEAIALFVFGYVKTGINSGWKTKCAIRMALKGAVLMVLVGATATSIAVGLIIGINENEHISR